MKLSKILDKVGFPLEVILANFKLLDNFWVKSNEENLEYLLENESDKVKFQQAVDQLLKDNNKGTKEINIKSRTIKISI